MTGIIEQKLVDIGLDLPNAAAPAGNYVPYVISGNLIFVSGQIPMGPDGPEYQGKLDKDFSIEDGQAAARLCALNLLAQVKAALDGDLDRVIRCVKLGGFVNAPADFSKHPQVINGASDLMVEVLGDAGRHARFAVGASNLPLDVAVEVDGIFEFA